MHVYIQYVQLGRGITTLHVKEAWNVILETPCSRVYRFRATAQAYFHDCFCRRLAQEQRILLLPGRYMEAHTSDSFVLAMVVIPGFSRRD